MALLSFIRPAILQPRRGRGLVWSGLKGGLAKAKFFYQSARPAGGAEAFPPARRMALLSFIRRTILQPGLAGGGTSGLADAPAGLQAVKGRMKQTEVYNTQMMCNSTCCIE